MNTQTRLAEEIATANQQLIDLFQLGDASGVTALYSDDAQFLLPHMAPIKGSASIEAVWKSQVGHGHALQFKTLELAGDDNSALELGEYTRLDKTGSTLDKGKYMVVWRRVAGAWRIHRDMLSTNIPLQT
ncbi:MAG: DUF4440 domain-containing protein [Undibacterium sp.]|nr:DUF4440 domain-containing protein [Undibacterium sp.]